MNELVISDIKNRIYTLRGVQVILDTDLAELYDVSVKRLNEQVKRNSERFPENFKFQLTQTEFEILRSQNATSKDSLRSQNATLENNRGKHRKYLPYVFTEQGISMLSAILKSKTAIKVSVQIINTFVAMKKFISKNTEIFLRLDSVERKQLAYQVESDENFEKLFKALDTEKPKQGIFYDGQIFDAYKFVCDLVKDAKQSIVLIDNYVDESVLILFSKRKIHVSVTIYTTNISQQLTLDINKFNAQYESIEVKEFNNAHDRFMIIDEDIYHFGASLKDLGKKWFAFSKFEKGAVEMLRKLE